MVLSKGRQILMSDGVARRYPVDGGATIYGGSYVALNSAGVAIACPANVGAGNVFAGIAAIGGTLDSSVVPNTNDGDQSIMVFRKGIFYVPVTGAAATAVGKPVYVTDDETLTITPPANGVQVGVAVSYEAPTQVYGALTTHMWVELQGVDKEAPKVKALVIPFVKKTSEFDTGVAIPAGATVIEAYLNVAAEVAASTVSVGTLSTASGDADGFLKTASAATAGHVYAVVSADAANKITLGDLLKSATITSADAGAIFAAIRTPYNIGAAAKKVSYTTTDHAISGDIVIIYVEA